MLNTRTNPNLKDAENKSALEYAIEYGHENIAIHLIIKGAEIDEDTIILAVVNEMEDLCTKLTSEGINIDITDEDGSWLLNKLIDQEYTGAALNAIRMGANVSIKDKFGITPLMSASRIEELELVSEILKHDPNINKQMLDGKTAAHLAAESGYLDILNLLEKNGADLSIKDGFLRTPMDLLSDVEKFQYLSISHSITSHHITKEKNDDEDILGLDSLENQGDVKRNAKRERDNEYADEESEAKRVDTDTPTYYTDDEFGAYMIGLSDLISPLL